VLELFVVFEPHTFFNFDSNPSFFSCERTTSEFRPSQQRRNLWGNQAENFRQGWAYFFPSFLSS